MSTQGEPVHDGGNGFGPRVAERPRPTANPARDPKTHEGDSDRRHIGQEMRGVSDERQAVSNDSARDLQKEEHRTDGEYF